MRWNSRKAFTLVELLVVITILAIISVVAYTSYGGAGDKAKNSTKLSNITSIEAALAMFNQKNNYYPMPAAWSSTNLWGYSGSLATPVLASSGNTINAHRPDGSDEIDSLTGSGGGYIVYSGATSTTKTDIIGVKGVIDSSVLSKEFLSADLYDPAIADIKAANKPVKDLGIGKFVYAVYSKRDSDSGNWNPGGKRGAAYNLATTIIDDQKDEFAKISGNFDQNFSGCIGTCPLSLIGPGGSSKNLIDGSTGSGSTPYPIAF